MNAAAATATKQPEGRSAFPSPLRDRKRKGYSVAIC